MQTNEEDSQTLALSHSLVSSVTVDEAYDLAGGHGRYQFLVALSAGIISITSMMYLFSVPLFLIFPEVRGCPEGLCPTKEAACRVRYTYADHSFNFVTEFDLLCSEFRGSLVATMFSVGFCAGILAFGTIGDTLGRLAAFTVGTLGTSLSILMLLLFPEYVVCLIASGLCGFFASGCFPQGLTYAYDSCHSKYVTFYATFMNTAFTVGELFVALFMWTGVSWRTMAIVKLQHSVLRIPGLDMPAAASPEGVAPVPPGQRET